MPNLTVKSVDESREWTGNFGTMIDYTLTIESDGKSGQVYVTKKPESPAPEAGESWDYEVVKRDKFGTKVKRVFDSPYAGPVSNGSPAATPSQAARNESIERQVATKCAAQVIAAYVASGKTPPAALTLADEFHQAIRGYTVEPDSKANIAQESLPKPDTDGLDAKPDPDDDIPF